MLASIANNQNEKEARSRIMSQYPPTLKGQLQALKHFTQEYIPAVKEGKGFDHIGRNSKMPLPPSHPQSNNSKQLVTNNK